MAADIWSVADKLRGHYMRHEYGEVILPLTVLRRLDAVMAKTRQAVRDRDEALTSQGIKNKDRPLQLAAKLPFYNTSKQDFSTITADNSLLSVRKNLQDYLAGFSENIQKIVERFDLYSQISRMFEAKILYQVVSTFTGMKDLEKLSTHDMGYVFEHLIRKFYEDANATAGEHFTPREVIHLMVNLLIAPDRDTISGEGQVINILDPACGTTGMLTAAEDKIKSFNPNARVYLWGQEFNPLAWATGSSECCCATSLARSSLGTRSATTGTRSAPMTARRQVRLHAGQPAVRGRVENRQAGHRRRKGRARLRGTVRGRVATDQRRFVPVPPAHDLQDGAGGRARGADWRSSSTGHPIHRRGGFRRVEHPEVDPGERLAGRDRRAAGPALLQHGISTYFWILTNRKDPALAGKVILLDARDQWEKMRKSLGDKRKQISDDQIEHITTVYGEALAVAADPEHPDHGRVKVFSTRDFGYQRITVERPLKQRFELTDDTLAALESSKALAKWDGRDALIAAFRDAVGSVWWTKRDAEAGLLAAAKAGGAYGPARLRWSRRLGGGFGLRPRRRGPDGQGCSTAGPRPARLRERAPGRGRERVLRPRGTPPRPRRLDRPRQDQDRLRDPLYPSTSMSTRRRGRSPRSTRNSATWKPRSRSSSAR